MPEGLEAEIWRRELEPTISRRITDAWIDDRVGPTRLPDLVRGRHIARVDRRGKVVLLVVEDTVIGLHLGMTGRIVTDGSSSIGTLAYSSGADRPEWDRLRIATDGSPDHVVPAIRMNDPRRLGRITIEPSLDHLGPDVLGLDPRDLAARLATRTSPIKSALLDQKVVAGLGNLLADEVLFWAWIDPRRRCVDLSAGEVERIGRAVRSRLPIMLRRGGSTTGVLDPERRRSLGPCPRDGTEVRRCVIGGRTTVWCPEHQR